VALSAKYLRALRALTPFGQTLQCGSHHGTEGTYRIFGDSHVMYICYYHPQQFEIHWDGPRTAHQLRNNWERYAPYINDAKPNLFMFGEVDIRGHIINMPPADRLPAVMNTVPRYVDAVREGAPRPVIVSMTPPHPESSDSGPRGELTQTFNRVLSEHCSRAGIPFIDAHTEWCKLTQPWADIWHLGATAADPLLALLAAVTPEL
jgi:hypothetical protein